MADRIELRGLRLIAIVGALPQERVRPQPIELDIDAELDLSIPAASDDLGDTVDYGEVCDVAEQEAGSAHPVLLEHLAVRIADAVLAIDHRLQAVEVAVRKLRPPVTHHLHTAGVRVRRSRAG